ncbi:MAG TPA: right-handed parallel beta-helix repeat-containing protein, partial [Pyrinomonadaceae bacterium]|nr:right-handed parallel beta-helix repeat-containing protein [Pyrinomonadaceae bacterium]
EQTKSGVFKHLSKILFGIVLLILIDHTAFAQKTINLQPGMTISSSLTVKKAKYRFSSDSDDGKQGVIKISGDNLTIDFNGAELIGTPENTPPDQRKGTAIQILNGHNITIKNLKVRGYKIGLIARNIQGLRILDSDFSYNWKQHLKSTLESEDLDDWMSYHQNEKDEWLRYGAGIYLRGCNDFEVRNVTIEGGQNGLMLMESNKGKIWNNNFSFLSSIGLGMYRSSENKVMHNNIDWCVRGYSHGVYNRGQDSAGILIYEQSNKNVFAYNYVTHGGDGFFLWAGQTTMDTGKGGANDNLIYGNDFSHAPTNGIETTFSRNDFVNNLVLECWHGVWGGYSFNSKFKENRFGLNAQAIAIEHGQDNEISNNKFYRNNEGIVLWANKTQDPNWGYAKLRDTKSRDYLITENQFDNTLLQVLSFRLSNNIELNGNSFNRNTKVFNFGEDVKNLSLRNNKFIGLEEKIPAEFSNVDSNWTNQKSEPNFASSIDTRGTILERKSEDYLKRFETDWSFINRAEFKYAPSPLVGGKNPFLKKGQLRGRRYIYVDEWGPYDFKSPILIPRRKLDDSSSNPTSFLTEKTQHFEILGPKGTWKIAKMRGAEWVSAKSGSVPGSIDVRLSDGKMIDFLLELEYRGGVVVSPFGVQFAKGTPYNFSYSKLFIPIDWNVKWFQWNETNDPRTKEKEFQKLLQSVPLKTEQTNRLNYSWSGSFGKDLPRDKFATLAEGTFEVPTGSYELNVTTDDGARVWIDDKLIIKDAWKYQGPTTYTAGLKLGGKHRIKVEHFEIDGFATLKVDLKPI